MSNISVGQIIMDAQRMAARVKDLDSLGSALLVEAEGNNRLVESLRQFQNDIDSLNRISNNKSNADMVKRIHQQNANSSEILKENRELKICIEDYERVMEAIMQKYREHTHSKIFESKINFKDLYNEKLWKIIREQSEKIDEMTAVMRHAVKVDDEELIKEMETMARLRMENKTLRDLLLYGPDGRPLKYSIYQFVEKAVQTEMNESFDDELSLSGASIENANNNSAIHISIDNSTAALENSPLVNMNNNNSPVITTPTTKLLSSSTLSSTSSSTQPNCTDVNAVLSQDSIAIPNNNIIINSASDNPHQKVSSLTTEACVGTNSVTTIEATTSTT